MPRSSVEYSSARCTSSLLPACVAMFTEEVGVSPNGHDGGAVYRARVAELIQAGRAFARFDGDQVVFGEGEPPPAFPVDFPIPAGAVIGTTLIDRLNHRSEMTMQIGGVLDGAVQNLTIGLVSQGYVITTSEGTDDSWTIAFMRGELRGEVVFQAVGGFTQAVASVNRT